MLSKGKRCWWDHRHFCNATLPAERIVFRSCKVDKTTAQVRCKLPLTRDLPEPAKSKPWAQGPQKVAGEDSESAGWVRRIEKAQPVPRARPLAQPPRQKLCKNLEHPDNGGGGRRNSRKDKLSFLCIGEREKQMLFILHMFHFQCSPQSKMLSMMTAKPEVSIPLPGNQYPLRNSPFSNPPHYPTVFHSNGPFINKALPRHFLKTVLGQCRIHESV